MERNVNRHQRYVTDDDYLKRSGRNSRPISYCSTISMDEFERPNSTSISDIELQDFRRQSTSSTIQTLAKDLGVRKDDDSFQNEMETYLTRLIIFQLLVNLLIHRGANPSARNNELKTALHLAVEKNFRGVCSKLLENDAYPNARDQNSKMPYTIAFEKENDAIAAMLIPYMSNIDVKKLYTSNGSENAEFSFHKLLDKNMQNTILAVMDCLLEQQSPSGHITVYYHLLECDEHGRVPNQTGFNEKSKSPLQIIAKSGNKTLVYHNVVRLLIRRKWKEYARFRFQVNCMLYLLTLVCLTFSTVVAVSEADPLVYNNPLNYGRVITEIWACLMAFITLLFETNQMRKHKLEYLQDPFNWIDLTSAVLILAAIPLRFLQLQEQWPVLSVAFLLWTLRVFKFAAVFRQTGAYAQILWRILAHDFIQFTVVFLVILLAFSGALLLSLKGDNSLGIHEETSSFWKTLFLGVRILTEADKIIEYTDLRPMSCIIMLMFLFTCCVILLNILIAQLSDTYQNVQQDAQRRLEVNRAWIVARVELNSMFFNKRHRTTHYKESELIKDISEVLERWETPPLYEMNKYVQDIYDCLDTHKMHLLTVRNRLARQESTLSKIQEQLERLVLTTSRQTLHMMDGLRIAPRQRFTLGDEDNC